jgi:hypothetical protein
VILRAARSFVFIAAGQLLRRLLRSQTDAWLVHHLRGFTHRF